MRRVEAEKGLVERLDDARLRGDGIDEVGFEQRARRRLRRGPCTTRGSTWTVARPSEVAAMLEGRESRDRIAAAFDDSAR